MKGYCNCDNSSKGWGTKYREVRVDAHGLCYMCAHIALKRVSGQHTCEYKYDKYRGSSVPMSLLSKSIQKKVKQGELSLWRNNGRV